MSKEPDWNGVFDAADINSDDRIDYEEFCVAAYDKRQLLNDENLEIAFANFDTD